MPRVTLVSSPSAAAAEQQRYEAELRQALAERNGGWMFRSVTVTSLRSRVGRAPLVITGAFGRIVYRDADLVHRLDLRVPPAPGREVVTVHDLAPLRFPDEGTLRPIALEAVRRAFGVICPSEFAAHEVTELVRPRQVWIAPGAVHEAFTAGPPLGPATLRLLKIEPPFIVSRGGATKRKNPEGLAAAWRLLQRDYPWATLVLYGPHVAAQRRLFTGLASVRMVGVLPPDTVGGLVRAAQAVVVPSHYEGFGLPVLEAMTAGTVAVAANRASLPELCGDGAILVEPTAEGLAAGMAQALDDGPALAAIRIRGRRRASQFSWARTADAHLAAYREALEN